MFGLEKQQVKIVNYNSRKEKHGDESVLAGDLKVESTCANSVLDHFDKSLRKMLYRKPKGVAEQTNLELGDDGLTELKMPHLAPQKWDDSFPGYTLAIDPDGLSDPLEFDDVELTGFTFEALQGGSVKVTFTAKLHPDKEQAGELCALSQEEIEITLTAPTSESQRQEQLAA